MESGKPRMPPGPAIKFLGTVHPRETPPHVSLSEGKRPFLPVCTMKGHELRNAYW